MKVKNTSLLIKVILIVGIVLWILSMVVYFFNLDMKLMGVLYPLFDKHYDKVERDKHL